MKATSTCARCGRGVIHVRTRLNVWMPLDPEPSPDGTIALVGSGDDMRAVLTGNLTLFDTTASERYLPHWGSCPDERMR